MHMAHFIEMISCFHEVYLFYFTDHQACYWNADNYSAIAEAFSDVFVRVIIT